MGYIIPLNEYSLFLLFFISSGQPIKTWNLSGNLKSEAFSNKASVLFILIFILFLSIKNKKLKMVLYSTLCKFISFSFFVKYLIHM